MIIDEITDADDIEWAGLSQDLDSYSKRIHVGDADTGVGAGLAWVDPSDDGRVIVTVDQSRKDAMDQLKREVEQIQRYFRKEFGSEKPHISELVKKFFGKKQKQAFSVTTVKISYQTTANSQSFLGPISCRRLWVPIRH